MNVFYRGVPNPVEISVPGVSSDKLDVRITGGHKIKPDGETFHRRARRWSRSFHRGDRHHARRNKEDHCLAASSA